MLQYGKRIELECGIIELYLKAWGALEIIRQILNSNLIKVSVLNANHSQEDIMRLQDLGGEGSNVVEVNEDWPVQVSVNVD